MRKILFLANIQYGEEPTGGGVQTRNQYMLNWLRQRTDVRFYDTWDKPSIVSFLSSLYLALICWNRLVVISYGREGALMLMKILNFFHCKRNIKFFVPGGDFLDFVKKKDLKYWACFEEILVQSNYMVNQLKALGLSNVSYCPNFKTINYRPSHREYKIDDPMRFVYVGRLFEKKGIDILISACKSITHNFRLTIYGQETERYNKQFFDKLKDSRILYNGYLNLKTKEGYDELASYDVLVFPTFYKGEGFPGTLIDAFICGLPIIATDFNANSEIVEDGITGIVIPPEDADSLAEVMRRMIDGEIDINTMSKNSYNTASHYDIDTVMGNFFKQ